MLQKYKTDASLLLDEYTHEFVRDMKFIEENIPAQDEDPESAKEENNEILDPAETLTRDLNSSEQSWKKVGDGWERLEDPPGGPEAIEAPKKADVPDWAKKLYRRIALVAHPDRASKDHEEARLKKIFLETSDAMATGDFNKLLGFALELDIPASEGDPTMVPLLQKRVEDIKEEISSMEASIEWLWGEGLGIHPMRANLARMHLLQRGRDVKIELLLSIIQKLEKDNEASPTE